MDINSAGSQLADESKSKSHGSGRPTMGNSRPSFFAEMDDDSLSLYEKKCILVNREIDRMGMGRYQWHMWVLCGFGYMLDLLWAQAFGLVLSPLRQELGFDATASGNISTSFNAGLTAGAFVWGTLSDIIGRRWAFNSTVLLASVFGMGLGGSNNYTTFLVLTAFVGFGVGGNVPIDTTITLEFLPQNKKFLLALLSIWQPIGVVICSAIAFAFIPTMSCSPNFSEPSPLKSCFDPTLGSGEPCCSRESNMGWRYFLFTLGAITIFVFTLRSIFFRFRESPKYLLYKGQDEKALEVIQHMARVNKQQCELTIEHFEQLDSTYSDSNDTSSVTRPGQQRRTSSYANRPGTYRRQSSYGRPSLNRQTSSFAGVLGSGARALKRAIPTQHERDRGFERYKMLFSSWPMTRLTLLVWLTYICDFWGFTVAGFYLPTILAIKNSAASNASLRFTYASYIYTYAPGGVGVVLGSLMYRVPAFGRKWTMVIASALMGISIILFSVVDTVPKNLGLFTMEYFFQSMFNAVLYGWTPEAFPAPVRGTACGVASFWGRLFGIVSPIIAGHLYGSTDAPTGNINAVLYLAGGVTLGCVLWTALLPNQMMETASERS